MLIIEQAKKNQAGISLLYLITLRGVKRGRKEIINSFKNSESLKIVLNRFYNPYLDMTPFSARKTFFGSTFFIGRLRNASL